MHDDARVAQVTVETNGVADLSQLSIAGKMVVLQQMSRCREAISRPAEDFEQHRGRHAEVRAQRLVRCIDELQERFLAPGDETLGWLLAHQLSQLLRVVARLGDRAGVLDVVLGCLRDDVADGVEARAPGAAGDLVELAGAQTTHARAVVFAQTGEQDGTDGHVDADPEGVGTRDDLEKSLLCKAFDEPSVARQHACVVDPDAGAEQLRQGGAESGGEAEVADRLGDLSLLLLGGDSCRQEGLRALDRSELREMHDVDRGATRVDESLDRLVDGCHRIRVFEGDRSMGSGDRGGGAAGASRQVVDEEADVAQRRRHQEELCVRKLDQWDFPRPSAIGLAVEVELVGDQDADIAVRTVAKCEVRDDLGGRADDRSSGVDRGVTGHQADLVGAELRAQIEELLADQCLDRRGVERALAPTSGEVDGAGRHERLPRTCRCGQDDVVTRDQLEQRLLLMRIEVDAAVGPPSGERIECGVVVGDGGQRRR